MHSKKPRMKYFKLILALLLAVLFLYPVGYFVLEPSTDTSYKEFEDPPKLPNKEPATIAYIINLDRSKERYEYVRKNVHALGFPVERISAIDGRTLSETEWKEKADLKTYKQFIRYWPKLGTIACSLSHIKVWETFLQSKFDYAVIFEDDISFDPERLRVTIDRLVEHSLLWDIVNFEIGHRGMPLPIKTFPDKQKLVIYLADATHAGAYLINRGAARKLLAKALPIRLPIDHYFTRGWELDLKYRGIENPRLVHQTFGDSEIGQTQPSTQEAPATSQIKRHLYKIQSSVIRFLYNLKDYLVFKVTNFSLKASR